MLDAVHMGSQVNPDTVILPFKRNVFQLNLLIPAVKVYTVFGALNPADGLKGALDIVLIPAYPFSHEVHVQGGPCLEPVMSIEKSSPFEEELILVFTDRQAV